MACCCRRCLNPTSSDTGGILANDWATPVSYKLDLLKELVPQPGQVSHTLLATLAAEWAFDLRPLNPLCRILALGGRGGGG